MSRLEKIGIAGIVFILILSLIFKAADIPAALIAPFSLPFIVLFIIYKPKIKE